MYSKAHPGKPDSLGNILLAIYGQLSGRVLLMVPYKISALYEHTCRVAGRVIHHAMERFDNLDNQPDYRGSCFPSYNDPTQNDSICS